MIFNKCSIKIFFTLILLILLKNNAISQVYNFTINGQTRQYYLHIPSSLPSNSPLVFVLHGYSGSATSIRNYSGMNQIADTASFAVCYPQGSTDQWNNRFWNVGYDFHQNQTVNDVEFLTALALYLQNQYNLSSQNTFCTGMSNGGDMSYLLACQASNTFSAVAPVAGCMMAWIYSSCVPSSPIPVFEIHGTNDNTTWWNGDTSNSQGWGAYMPVLTSFNFWVQLNNCTQSVIDTLPDVDPADGSIVISEKHSQGINNNEVWLYKVLNGGHDWPGSSGNMDINASEEIWNFFNQVINASYIREINEDQTPNNFVLHQNYPNPFNPATIISYNLPENSFLTLTIYDILGKEVVKLVNTTQAAGRKYVQWNAMDSKGRPVSSGTYLYQLKTDRFVKYKKMIVLR